MTDKKPVPQKKATTQGKPPVDLPPLLGEDPERFILWRNAWNMDVSHKAMQISALLGLSNLIVLVILIVVLMTQKNYFFSVDPMGRVRPVPALGVPEVSDALVLSFARQTVLDVYQFDYVNWRSQLSQAFRNLSDYASRTWMNTLNDNGIMDIVKKDRLVVQCVPTGIPVLEASGMINGRYSWRISMPAQVTFYSANESKSQSILATVLVSRVEANTDHLNGLEVISIDTKNIGGSN